MNSSSSSSLGAVSCPINSNTFPGKLWKLVNGGRFQSIGWSNGGSCIAINGTTFKNEVLYNDEFSVFKTQNFSSFVRQLNLYGFRKLAAVSSKDSMSGEDIHHFQNPYFNRNRPGLLGHVRRASNRHRGGSENAENSYFTTSTPYRFGSFASGSANVNPQTLFHHQGITYAPVKFASQSHTTGTEPLRDINNRFNPYSVRPSHEQQQCSPRYGRSWGAAEGGLQGLTLIANTSSGSLTATCPAEPRPVDYPSLYNRQGQLKKFVVIQEDNVNGQGLQNSSGGISLSLSVSRNDDVLLSNSRDPMMCAIPQPSPPHQTPPQTFILSPPPAPQSQQGATYHPAASGTTTSGPGCTPTPQRPAPPPGNTGLAMQPTVKLSPVVYTQLSPIEPATAQTQRCSSHQMTGKGIPVATSLPAVSCGNVGALSSVVSTGVAPPPAMLQVQGSST